MVDKSVESLLDEVRVQYRRLEREASLATQSAQFTPIETVGDRIREERPGFFMFAEAWSYDVELLAEYTYPKNGGISVLDFPGRQAMVAVFGKIGGSYADLRCSCLRLRK